MTQPWIDMSSAAFAAAGVIVLLLAALFRLRWESVVPVTLELWTAAGLLRLMGEPTWSRIAAAASIVMIRRLITPALMQRWLVHGR